MYWAKFGATPTPQKSQEVASQIVIPSVDIRACLNLAHWFHLTFSMNAITETLIVAHFARFVECSDDLSWAATCFASLGDAASSTF